MTNISLEYELRSNPQFLIFELKTESQRNNNSEKIPLDTKTEIIMNHFLLILGLLLNFLIIIVFVLNHSMHKSTSCYILSFILSNLILLLDTLRKVLTWWNSIDMVLDIPYIINLTFNASILTLAMLTVDRYIFIHKRHGIHNSIYNIIPQLKTAAKSVVIIWIMTSIATAMELHLYTQFKRDAEYSHSLDPRVQIFMTFTFVFTVMPMILIFSLGGLLIYEMDQLRAIESVHKENVDVDSLRLLVGIAVGFLLTMVPYKVALIMNYTFPIICCSKDSLKVYFAMIKGSSLVIPLICFATWNQIQTAFKNTFLYCQCLRPKNSGKTTLSGKG